MVAKTKIARRRLLAAVAGISAAVLTERASANSLDWRNLSGNDTAPADSNSSSVQTATPSGTQSSTSRTQAQTLCFLKGTRIATPDGDCRIEDLQVGQLVTTVSGDSKPVQWLGHSQRFSDGSGHWSNDALPITIEAHALAENIPNRDLHVSPEHALYIDGLLIPAKHLINGTTIYPMSSIGLTAVDYYHLELDVHDAVLAEGAPAETFRDTGTRWTFDSAVSQTGFEPTSNSAQPFAPLVEIHGRRAYIATHLRSAASLIVDLRGQFELTRDRVSERGLAIAEAREMSIAA